MDPRLFVIAVKMARDWGISAEELHAYFPGLSQAVDDSEHGPEDDICPHVSGDMLPTPEEYYECLEAKKLGFK